MLRHTKDLRGFKLASMDDEFGKVKEFYFDDYSWIVRYLVADTGRWLPGRQVLVAPFSIERINEEAKMIHLKMTRGEVEKSPSVLEDRPVSRQAEEKLAGYYGWPAYWEGKPDPHLRSTKEVINYGLEAQDGRIGKIEDFIIEDSDWSVSYMIVDAGDKTVLLALDWIERIDEEKSSIYLDVRKDMIRDSPVYTKDKPINRLIETELFDHYKKKYYWTR